MRLSFIVLPLLILLGSCASNFRVSSFGCTSSASWFELSGKADFRIEQKVWSSSETKKIFIKKILKKEKIDCKNLKSLSLETKRTWGDVFVSVLPWWRRSTVILTGSTFVGADGGEEDDEDEEDDDEDEEVKT